ncbi:MAG: hypothetical protein V3R73_00505 [Sphingomonadales bacterium]
MLALYAMLQGAAAEALRFLFVPDFSKISADVVLLAVGQALLTLSVGGAGMLVYGAYLAQDASIPRAAAVVALADTLVALLAGLMIFPIVFAFGLPVGEGPGLIFVTMPMAFGQMTGGNIFGALFFLLLLIAALSSALSMFEPVVAWLAEKKGISRLRASILAGLAAWLIGLSAAFSFNIWSEVRPLFFLERLREANIFRSLEYVVANISVPVGALLVVIFVGWMMSERSRVREFGGAPSAFSLWRFFMRFVVPLALLAILGARLMA